MFRNEVALLSSIHHDNIVQLIETFEDDGAWRGRERGKLFAD